MQLGAKVSNFKICNNSSLTLHPPPYAETKKLKSLTLDTNDAIFFYSLTCATFRRYFQKILAEDLYFRRYFQKIPSEDTFRRYFQKITSKDTFRRYLQKILSEDTYACLLSIGRSGVFIVRKNFPPRYSSFSAFLFPIFHFYNYTTKAKYLLTFTP